MAKTFLGWSAGCLGTLLATSCGGGGSNGANGDQSTLPAADAAAGDRAEPADDAAADDLAADDASYEDDAVGGSPMSADDPAGDPPLPSSEGPDPLTPREQAVPNDDSVPANPVGDDSPAPIEEPEPDTCAGLDRSTLTLRENGWIDGACNDAGITGGWYCYADEVNPTSCSEGIYDPVSAGLCLDGTTTVDETYAAWGAAIAFSLNSGEATDWEAAPYNATAAGVVGFRITIEGDTGGNPLNVVFSMVDEGLQPLVAVPGPGTYDVYFEDALVPLQWDVPEAGKALDPSAVVSLAIQIPGGNRESVYSFCVTEVTPLSPFTGEIDLDAVCPPERASGASLGTLAQEFTETIYPLMTRAAGGCVLCHHEDSTRQLIMKSSALDTFHSIHTAGFFTLGDGSMLDRVLREEMPRAALPWSRQEKDELLAFSCKATRFDLNSESAADESFPSTSRRRSFPRGRRRPSF
jgi:hypothetical protein